MKTSQSPTERTYVAYLKGRNKASNAQQARKLELWINAYSTSQVLAFLKSNDYTTEDQLRNFRGLPKSILEGVDVILAPDGSILVGPGSDRFWGREIEVPPSITADEYMGLIDESVGGPVAWVQKQHMTSLLCLLKGHSDETEYHVPLEEVRQLLDSIEARTNDIHAQIAFLRRRGWCPAPGKVAEYQPLNSTKSELRGLSVGVPQAVQAELEQDIKDVKKILKEEGF